MELGEELGRLLGEGGADLRRAVTEVGLDPRDYVLPIYNRNNVTNTELLLRCLQSRDDVLPI